MKVEDSTIKQFVLDLEQNEYSLKTTKKYQSDIKKLAVFLNGKEPEKKDVIYFKEQLCRQYKPRSVNSILAACNHFFEYVQHAELRVKPLRIQQQVFCSEEKDLTRKEYKALVGTATRTGKEKLALIIQTLCSTGIRISELEFITAKAVKSGRAEVRNKGKNRTILIHQELRKKLLYYMARLRIKSGSVFITKTGKPCDRSNLWREMKKLAETAKIHASKVFPHNLRHLFAKEFYMIRKDIVQLADVMGHSNINTTRIYMISTGKEHQKTLQKMDLIL